MSESLLPSRFLFRFAIPCRYRDPLWGKEGTTLDVDYRLVGLAELDRAAMPADVRAAWSAAGLAFTVIVSGKRQPPWCRSNRVEDSDGVAFWIDTRDVHNVHRASRFCHSLLFLPAGGGNGLEDPVAVSMPINRAREQPRPIEPGRLSVRSKRTKDGYVLDVLIPGEVLTGFDPAEHPKLGFNYALIDRELGQQTLSVGSPMPFQDDPSLWATLELVR